MVGRSGALEGESSVFAKATTRPGDRALPRLRGVAAEVESVFTLGREIDFRDEARLTDGLRPRLPTLRAAGGGGGIVGRRSGVVGIGRIPHVPARGGNDGERLAVHPLEQQWGVDRKVRLERRGEIKCPVADAASGGAVGRGAKLAREAVDEEEAGGEDLGVGDVGFDAIEAGVDGA